MKIFIFKISCLLVIIISLLSVNACIGSVKVGELQRESHSIELGKAESVHVDIKMGAGKLKIAGGADRLLNADFVYNVSEWKPKINYQASNSHGKLIIQQPSGDWMGGFLQGNVRYEWDLHFNNDIPISMNVELSAGDNYLKLGHLSLKSLYVGTGAGNVTLDLTGNPSLNKLDLNIGSGNVKVDLNGEWKRNLNAYINGGIGRISLYLPSHVGVLARADRGIGKIDAFGMKKDNNTYTNDAYGKSEVTLYLRIKAGIGKINLEVGT